MRFIEKGDVESTCRLVDLNPHIGDNQNVMSELLRFAARHGQYNILKYLARPQSSDEILNLIDYAKLDGHRPMIRYLMSCLAKNFNYLDLNTDLYQIVVSKVPDRAKGSVFFPYVWDQIKCIFFVIKYSENTKIKNIPLRKLIKFIL